RDQFGTPRLGLLGRVEILQWLLPPAPSKRFVERDAGEPGRERGLALETVESRERLHVGLLHDVLGFRVVAQDSTGRPEEPLVVAPYELADGRLVAPAGEGEELGFGARQVG